MSPLLLLRVGYMDRYDGPDTITSGGAYVEERGVGGEVLNFKPSRGRCYGYAMSLHNAGLNLASLERSKDWQIGDELPDVDVVFFAKRPGGGQVIVGWYRGATVFHKQYRVRRGVIPGMDEKSLRYLCEVDASQAVLLKEDQRTFEVPYAPIAGRGFSGQSNVWYPGNQSEPDVVKFVRGLRKYVASTRGQRVIDAEIDLPNRSGTRSRTRTPNHALNAEVELAAVEAVCTYFHRPGYTVRKVERENLGWDLEVTKARRTIYVEVKGVSASSVRFELTPNEYAKLQQHSKSYRVCVVCDALTKPRVFEFTPRVMGKDWQLFSVAEGALVKLMERTAAVGVEVALGPTRL